MAEIATQLGITRDSIYRWIDSQNTPEHRVGRHSKFRRDEVGEWVRSGGAGRGEATNELNSSQP